MSANRRATNRSPQVHVIDPHGVYFADSLLAFFRLKRSTIAREVREGRLRISRRAGRYYVLGKWLIEWLEGGEVPRRRDRAGVNGAV